MLSGGSADSGTKRRVERSRSEGETRGQQCCQEEPRIRSQTDGSRGVERWQVILTAGVASSAPSGLKRHVARGAFRPVLGNGSGIDEALGSVGCQHSWQPRASRHNAGGVDNEDFGTKECSSDNVGTVPLGDVGLLFGQCLRPLDED